MKDPKKVKAGQARWKGVSKKDRKEYASVNGKKGATSLWKRYKLTPIENEKVK